MDEIKKKMARIAVAAAAAEALLQPVKRQLSASTVSDKKTQKQDPDKTRTPLQETELLLKNSLRPTFSNPDELITFKIVNGTTTTNFLIHKEFACFYSPVFNAALNTKSNFIESQTQTYIMEDVEVETFQIFSLWLYSQTLNELRPMKNEYPSWRNLLKDEVTKHFLQQERAVDLWLFGQRILCPKLQNAVKDVLILLINKYGRFAPGFFQSVYENTLAGSPLRRMAISLKAMRSSHIELSWEDTDRLPKEMMWDLVVVLKQQQAKNQPWYAKDYDVVANETDDEDEV